MITSVFVQIGGRTKMYATSSHSLLNDDLVSAVPPARREGLGAIVVSAAPADDEALPS